MSDKNKYSRYNSFYNQNSSTVRLSKTTRHRQKKKKELIKALGDDHFLIHGTNRVNQSLQEPSTSIENETFQHLQPQHLESEACVVNETSSSFNTSFNENLEQHPSNEEFDSDYIIQNEESLNKINLNELDPDEQLTIISNTILSLFFAGNLTQSSLNIITEFTRLFTNIKIPSTFNQLLNLAQIKPFEYTKKFFCQHCSTEAIVKGETRYKRKCSTCDYKYKKHFYLFF